jgi:hypothetical protein
MVEKEVDGMPFIDFIRDDKNMPVAMAFDSESQVKKQSIEKRAESGAALAKRQFRTEMQQKIKIPSYAKYVINKLADAAIDREFMDAKKNAMEKQRARMLADE